MNREDAYFLCDTVLTKAGLTPAQYARSKGLIANDGTPRTLLVTTAVAEEICGLTARTFQRRVRDDRGLAACRRKVGQLNLWHLPSLERWADPDNKKQPTGQGE